MTVKKSFTPQRFGTAQGHKLLLRAVPCSALNLRDSAFLPFFAILMAVATVRRVVTQSADWNRDTSDPTVAEALRRWQAGVRVTNLGWFEWGLRKEAGPNFRCSDHAADGAFVRLNSDLPYPETNVRYFMADIALGGSIEFYRRVAEEAHEMSCLEAVRRVEEGYRITNLDRFERKNVDGQTLITRKGSNERISGMDVQLSTD